MIHPNHIPAFLEHLKKQRASGHTLISYNSVLMGYHSFRHRETDEKACMRAYMASMHAAGLAPATVAMRRSTIKSYYEYLVGEGILEENPLGEVAVPRRTARLPKFLDPDKIAAMMTEAEKTSPRDHAMLEVLYSSGMRSEELVTFTLADLDLDEGTIRVRGGGDKDMVVIIGPTAIAALKKYLGSTKIGGEGTPSQSSGPVFPYHPRMAARAIDQYAQAAGITESVTPRVLRHSFSTNLPEGGGRVDSVL